MYEPNLVIILKIHTKVAYCLHNTPYLVNEKTGLIEKIEHKEKIPAVELYIGHQGGSSRSTHVARVSRESSRRVFTMNPTNDDKERHEREERARQRCKLTDRDATTYITLKGFLLCHQPNHFSPLTSLEPLLMA